MIQEFGDLWIRGFGDSDSGICSESGIQRFRYSGIQGFRDSGIQGFGGSDIQGFGDFGVQGFWDLGIRGFEDESGLVSGYFAKFEIPDLSSFTKSRKALPATRI